MRLPVPRSRLPSALAEPGGLRGDQLASQRARYGDNLIAEAPRRTWGARIRETASDPMLWFLFGTAVVYFWLGELLEGLVLLLAVVPLTGMDAFLHHRTRASTEALESRLAARARVVRDGRAQDIAARELVVGDLALLGTGALVPADGLLVEAQELQAEESSLTGEAYPVRKRALAELPPGEAPLVDAVHWALAGTRVLTGQGALRVVRTGRETLYGQIAHSAEAGARARTPLQAAVAQLVAVLTIAASVLCVILAVVRVRQGHGWVDAVVSAATLAVAALPEEFPIALTFFLGAGIYRLARRQALVRRAVSVENIGRVSVICSDKTGTVTEGRLAVTRAEPAAPFSVQELLAAGARASRADGGDPLDAAILEEAQRVGAPLGGWERLATFPFTEERRRETGLWAVGGTILAATKGTPELVLGLCGLDEAERTQWMEAVERLAGGGGKPIACALQQFPREAWRGGEPDRGFRFAGLIACEDRIREGVPEALARCAAAGLRVILVTGDHPATAEAVARSIGLGAGGRPRVVQGDELDRALAEDGALPELDVVARALPAQKLSLVRALQRQGERVAVTGDGVNDVPALQAADVGVAMGERGTQSAREAAAIVLLSDNFTTIVGAIAEGRQLFANLRAAFEYLLLVHIPLVVTAALIPLAGYPLLYLPIHIVWLELLIHPTALLSFQSRARSERLEPLPRARKARFFSWRDWAVIGATGALLTAAVAWGFLHALGEEGQEAHGRGMALVVLTTASALAGAVLSGLRTRASRAVAAATALSSPLLVQVPPLAALLHVQPLHLDDWLWALATSVVAAAPLWMDRLLLQGPDLTRGRGRA